MAKLLSMIMNNSVYVLFWIYLTYFMGFLFIVTGHFYGYQSWIYYGLFFGLFGLLLNISLRVVTIEYLLMGADIKYEFGEDE